MSEHATKFPLSIRPTRLPQPIDTTQRIRPRNCTAMDDFDSATYSIESEPDRKRIPLDDVILPTVRRSAIQIVSLSPRRQAKRSMPLSGDDNGTMQITKLVLKTPPGSPKRQSKTPGVLVKSIQTLAGPGLTGAGVNPRGTVVAKVNSVLTEKRNLAVAVADDPTTTSYRIIPILSPQNKDSKKEFEARRTEREHATHEFQDFLRESFKENKTPPSTPPLPVTVPSSSSAIEVTRSVESTGPSDIDSATYGVLQSKSIPKAGMDKLESVIEPKEQMKAIDPEYQQAMLEKEVYVVAPTPAARRSLLLETPKVPPSAVPSSGERTTIESINRPLGEKIGTTSVIQPPQVIQESHETVESEKATLVSNPVCPKPPPKSVTRLSANKTAMKEELKKKEKSYDPARAREFMKEQQAKRRLERKEPNGGTGSNVTSAAEKDLIKQRLETLRQSSQKLVSKNLQKVRTRSLSCAPNEGSNVNKQNPHKGKITSPAQTRNRTSAVRPTMGLRKFASTPALRLVKSEHKTDAVQTDPLKIQGQLPSRNVPEPHSIASRSSDGRPRKDSTSGRSANPSIGSNSTTDKTSLKIGILRKPDSMNLDDIVSPIPMKEPISTSSQKMHPTTRVNAKLIMINSEQEKAIEAAERELKLQVPDVKLVPPKAATVAEVSQDRDPPHVADRQEEILTHDYQSQPVKSIPSWLKQSLRQPDPYPFILAVRKKLEAVQHVREETGKPAAAGQAKEEITQQQPSTKYNSYLNEIESVPYIRKKAVNQPTEGVALHKRQSKDCFDGESAIVTKISACTSPNTTSEISSIKSDIALSLPPLLSSTKIENTPPATTTVPFYPATASGPISPLSVERISHMKIASPGSVSRSSRSGDHAKSLESRKEEKARPQNRTLGDIPAVQHSANDAHLDRSQREVEYQRLLESFNRSLTHVIEVNQQLYSALKNVPSGAALPPFSQEVLRIRDEMTQTSLAMAVPSLPTVDKAVKPEQQQGSKASGGTTTTASNYSDDFEHQSQTEVLPPVPERKPDDTAATSPVSSTTSFSGSSSPSSSGNDNSAGSSDTAGSSSSSSISSSMDNERIDSPRSVENHPTANATDEERKAKSNTTTAHSSDFDSRSFSLSDSHNNTMNNQPPMPEEYLPSFEESLRRRQLPAENPNDGLDKRGNEDGKKQHFRDKDGSRESSISEKLPPPDGQEEQSFSLQHTEKANDLKVNAVPRVSSSSQESIKKHIPQVKTSKKGAMAYEENLDATINSDLLAAMFNRTDLEVSILSTTVSETNLSYSSIGMENERGEDEAVKSESYSMTFEEQSNEGADADVTAAEESQQLIEDMSLPPMLLNNTAEHLMTDGDEECASSSSTSSSCESSATVELSVPLAVEQKVVVEEELPAEEIVSSDTSISLAQSFEEVGDSSSVSNTTTPTTITPTMTIEIIEKEAVSDRILEDERSTVDIQMSSPTKDVSANLPVTSESDYEEDVFHTKSSSGSISAGHGTTSELAKRLATLHDELEELSETFERTPLMKSPLASPISAQPPKPDHQSEDQNSSEETITFDYDEEGGEITPPFSDDPPKDEEEQSTSEPSKVGHSTSKIEVKLRSKVTGSGSGQCGSNALHHNHTESVSTPSPPPSPSMGVRMPDIINEAEVLRRQQLQIEQEIKELEQQVGFFREIPNKPPPPYIPPANGSPLALLFPCETRIDELIDGRVEALHRDRIAPDSLRSDHVTNVYEKLILDMCKEFYHDLRPAEPTVSFRTIAHDKRPLVKRKPDQVDEILKQEAHDDDARWTNFDREEIEVKDRITDELLKSLLLEALKDMGKAYGRRMKRNELAKRQQSAM
uniref:Uncharacterized protein n=1 Tax=Anopheles christyi TaxID=43041 RepID=A0A182K6N7_9DIPT